MLEDCAYAVGPAVIFTLRELFLYVVLSLSNICIPPSKRETVTHKETVRDKLGVGKGNPVQPMMLVVLKGPIGFVKLGVDIGSPVEPTTRVTLMGVLGIFKLGVKIESPVEAMMRVVLKGSIGFVKLGVGRPVEPMRLVMFKRPIGFVKLGVDTARPVEPMMLVILTGLKGAVEEAPVVSRLDVRFDRGSSIAPVDRRLVEKLGTDAPEVEGVGTFTISVERLNESVEETFPAVDIEKPELGRVGMGRVIVVSREIGVVEMVMVLRDVGLLKGEVTARVLLSMEGIDLRLDVIEGGSTAISVVMPVESVLRYSKIVSRALAVRVRVCISYIS